MIHRLVAEAFIDNPNHLSQVNHKDGDKGNNNVTNLEWCTPSDNITHSYEHGLRPMQTKGEYNPNAKLTNLQAADIRQRYRDSSVSIRKLAETYGVSYKTIWEIVNNISY